MDVYLDHHATTPCRPDVVAAMLPWFTTQFGNAASRSHRWGYAARSAVESARGTLGEHLGCSPKSLVFTSGATEADNLAILGVLRANRERGDHFITVVTEHKAVLDAAEAAEREGFRVTRLPVDQEGRLDPGVFENAITSRTVLASVMWVNNEIGTIQPLEALGAICRRHNVLLHTDAAQALSWVDVDLRSLPVDLASFSAHKAYGPKGVGALYVRRGRPAVQLTPLQFGGGHERGLRSGTLPVPLIVGFAAAVAGLDRSVLPTVAALRQRLLEGLVGAGGITENGSSLHRVAGNLNVRVDGVDVKGLLLACPDIAMSSGSACTSASLQPSHVLQAIGLTTEEASQSLRFGLGLSTTRAEIDHAISTLVAAIDRVRRLPQHFPGGAEKTS